MDGAYMLALIVLAFLAIIAYLWYRVAYMRYNVFTKIGIPGPRPKAFFGNFVEFSKGGVEYVVELINKYGKVCGVYRGGMPRYVIADPDIVKQIAVKNFSHFIDRSAPYILNGVIQGMNGGKGGLLFGVGDKWRQTRRIVTPTFTSGKMKLMVDLLSDSCSALTERIHKIAETGKSEDMMRLYGEFTMETVLATAFGYKVELLRGKVDGGDELIQVTQNIFDVPMGGGMMAVTLSCLHSHFMWLTPLMRWLGSRLPIHKDNVTLREEALRFVQARRSNPIVKKDFLQLIIDARVDDDESQDTSSQTKKKLTDEDIVAVATDFIMAGYETTSNTLGYTSYLLALNTDKQDKLCAEINAYYEKNEESSLYDAAMSIEYLDWIIQESLRIYPPGAHLVRYCQKTCTIENITFLEGSDVFIPIYAIHHSSEYWKEPDQFIPERFHPDEKAKRHPLAHMPFGLGPRSCVGMRLALMEAKMALLSMLTKFKFERSPDTEVPLKTKVGITLSPVNGIHLIAVKR